MKIVIQHKAKPNTGKGQFIDRLIPALESLGCEVTGDISEKADIALHVGRVHYESKARKNILRVGPACVDTNKKYKAVNKEKADSVKKCDAIIYQSKYSKKVYHHLVCKPDVPETIILNGAENRTEHRLCSGGNPKFLLSTRRWWPQKRLKYAIRGFYEAAIPESDLIIAGDYSMTKWAKGTTVENNIHFVGLVEQSVLAALRESCNMHMHLTWLDACPNSVSESLMAGCPVVCTNAGGTRELVECDTSGYSVILNEDDEYDYKPVNLDKPPKLDISEIALQFRLYSGAVRCASAPELDINRTAVKYMEFFQSCLK